MSLCCSVLVEQWIRAKYERKEFVDSSRQSYITAHKDGVLWKQAKASTKFARRRFVLSEANNSLIYFNKSHVSGSFHSFC